MTAAPERVLVAYFSQTAGNTERVAERLADGLGADVARIETVEPYPDDYDEVVEQGRREVDEGYEPEIVGLEVDPGEYDAICVGTPTWWYTMAPAVRTFMGQVGWAGRTLVPFMTNGGWPGAVIEDMEALARGARVVEPMEVRFDSTGGSRIVTPRSDVEAWVDRVARELDR
jgi:flavodoxin